MAMRDKNGENASERIARKFLSGEHVNECNTKSIIYARSIRALRLYNAEIAFIAVGVLFINDYHQFSDSKLTKEHKQALREQAKKLGIEISE